MILLDSNILIYATLPEYNSVRTFIANESPIVSLVSKIEMLGYQKLQANEKKLLEHIFDAVEVVGIHEDIAQYAIDLRRKRRMTLGDALIAGTALSLGCPLATHNTEDFEWIIGLRVVDPVG